MFLCHDPETAGAAAARAAARTADRAGAGSCCDVICAEERHRRQQGSVRLRQQDKLRRPQGEAKAKPPADSSKASDTEICVVLERAEGLPQADFMGTADPYVEILLMSCDPLQMEVKTSEIKDLRGLSDKTLFKATSRIIRGSLAPEWQESFYFSIPQGCEDSTLYLRVLDYDLMISDDFLGHCSIGVLNALEWNRPLSAGWQALIRSAKDSEQRLMVLRDPKVAEAPHGTGALKLLPAPGQESTYDLSSAKVFLKVSLSRSRSLAQSLGPLDLDEGTATQLLGRAAAANDLWALVALLSSARVSVNAPLREAGGLAGEHTVLLMACLRKQSDMAMALVDVFGASLVSMAPGGRSCAMCACEARAEELAEWLISEGVPADLMDDAGRNLLFYAVKEALPQITAFLLGHQRLSPCSRDLHGASPLSVAVASQLPASVVVAKQLLEAKAAADRADKKGNFPLHEACRAGNEQCVKLLLSHGNVQMQLDALDSEGQRPSALARAAGLPEATVKLLEAKDLKRNKEPETSRKQGESFEEAEKRELRARKAAISAEADASWQAWRALHPRTDADLERLLGSEAEARTTFSLEELDDPYFSLLQPKPPEVSSRRASEPHASTKGTKGWGVPGFSFKGQGLNFRAWMKRSVRSQSYGGKQG